jgi:S1-C subfamily serine protease
MEQQPHSKGDGEGDAAIGRHDLVSARRDHQLVRQAEAWELLSVGMDHQLVDAPGVEVVGAADVYLTKATSGSTLAGVDAGQWALLRKVFPRAAPVRPRGHRCRQRSHDYSVTSALVQVLYPGTTPVNRCPRGDEQMNEESVTRGRALGRRPPFHTPLSALAVLVFLVGSVATACTAGNPKPGAESDGSSTSAPPASVHVAVSPPATVSAAASAGSLLALQQAFVGLVAKVRAEVVEIATGQALGSGVVLDSKGDIVTNNHVVGSATQFQVQTVTGQTVGATLVGTYPPDDLAVIRATTPLDIPAATFGNSASLRAGSIVFAVGSPLGLASSVTEGIVSYNGRPVSEGNGVELPATIQTSAAINPGNSGGALVDLAGEVVGIPTLAALDQEEGGAAGGIGFAIPSDTVMPIAQQLLATGRVTNSGQAAMVVQGSDAVDSAGNPVGVIVGAVPAGSSVARSGLVPGDIIIAVSGHPTPTLAELQNVVAGLHSGETVTAQIITPGGAERTVSVVLGNLNS